VPLDLVHLIFSPVLIILDFLYFTGAIHGLFVASSPIQTRHQWSLICQ